MDLLNIYVDYNKLILTKVFFIISFNFNYQISHLKPRKKFVFNGYINFRHIISKSYLFVNHQHHIPVLT